MEKKITASKISLSDRVYKARLDSIESNGIRSIEPKGENILIEIGGFKLNMTSAQTEWISSSYGTFYLNLKDAQEEQLRIRASEIDKVSNECKEATDRLRDLVLKYYNQPPSEV